MTEHATEWVDFERKVVDQVPSTIGGRSRLKQVVLSTGRGQKKKNVRLYIPRNMFRQEIKRWFNAALADAVSLDSPAGTPYKTNSFGAIIQGGAAINRIGDAINVLKVVYRLLIVPNSTITWSGAEMAWLLDNEPAVGISTWNVPFNTIGAASTGLYHCAIPAYDTRLRYKQLKRLSHVFETTFVWNGSAFTGSTKPLIMEVEIPVRRKVQYDATNAVYAGCELAVYGWQAAASNQPTLSMSIEVFFTDA